MFILDANKLARDRDGLPTQVNGLIEAAGGVVEVSRLWEERRLAYPIKGQRKGAYWITYFKLPTGKITELTRQCELHDSILRQLFVRLPEALVDPILEHAKGVPPETPAPVEESSSPKAAPAAVEEVTA